MSLPIRLWFVWAALIVFQTPRLVVFLLRDMRGAAHDARLTLNTITAQTIATMAMQDAA